MASTLTVDNIVGATTAGNIHIPNSVVQTIHGSPSTGISYDTTTGTIFDMMTLNITPKYNTSKILIIAHIGMYMNSGSAEVRGEYMLRRDTTTIFGRDGTGGSGYFRDSSGRIKAFQGGFNYLDSPATASQITYRLGWKGHTHAAGGQFNEDYTSMTLMEIAQ